MSKKVPHKYADVIKAWADGATVQRRKAGTNCQWEDETTVAEGGTPYFCLSDYEWRVKPIEHKFKIRDLVRVTANESSPGCNWCAYPVGAVVRVKTLHGDRSDGVPSYLCEGYDSDGHKIGQFLTEKQVASFDI